MTWVTARKGEGYVDTCVGVLVLMMVLVLALNVFHFLSLKQHMEEVGNQLVEVATYSGQFGEEFQQLAEKLERDFGYQVQVEAQRYFDAAKGRVQLGDGMTVEVTAVTSLQGFGGAVELPITARVRKSGLSEKYWK